MFFNLILWWFTCCVVVCCNLIFWLELKAILSLFVLVLIMIENDFALSSFLCMFCPNLLHSRGKRFSLKPWFFCCLKWSLLYVSHDHCCLWMIDLTPSLDYGLGAWIAYRFFHMNMPVTAFDVLVILSFHTLWSYSFLCFIKMHSWMRYDDELWS